MAGSTSKSRRNVHAPSAAAAGGTVAAEATAEAAGGNGAPARAQSGRGAGLGAAGGMATEAVRGETREGTGALANVVGGTWSPPVLSSIAPITGGEIAPRSEHAAGEVAGGAGADGAAGEQASSRVAGGHAGGGTSEPSVARQDALSFHVHAPHGHVVSDEALPGIGDVGDNPTYVERGSTAHFVVYYDSALGNTGTSASDAVLARCESDYNTLQSWFSNATPGSMPFNIYITTDSGGASHASCSATTLYLGANSSNPVNNNFILQLLVAEEDEVFEAAFGHGWNCGASNGEGLSRVLANDLYPGAEPSNFVSSGVWLDTPGRPDWINNTEGTDRNYVSIGCSVLFLNWMRFQLGYGWQQIIAAGDSTLAKTYQNLTGETDGYAQFMALMNATYPAGTPSGLTTDNPFPLQDLAYTAVFRPSSGAEWVVPAQPWSSMFNTINTYFKQGLYVQALNATADDNNVMYSAVFRPGSGTEWVVPAEPWSSMGSVINNYFKQGLYVSALSITASGNEILYSAVFRPGSGAEWVTAAQPWSQFATTATNYFNQGLRIDSLAITIQNGTALYSAVFRPGSGAQWVTAAQVWPDFATAVNNYLKQGLYATGIGVVEASSGQLYSAVFRPAPSGAEWVVGNWLWKDFAKQVNTYFAQGLYATGIATCPLVA